MRTRGDQEKMRSSSQVCDRKMLNGNWKRNLHSAIWWARETIDEEIFEA